jgi:hypothetical protein
VTIFFATGQEIIFETRPILTANSEFNWEKQNIDTKMGLFRTKGISNECEVLNNS